MRAKLPIRLVALLLVPCLLQEPAQAYLGFWNLEFGLRGSFKSTIQNPQSKIEVQALAPYLFSDGHIPEPEAKHLRSEAGDLQRAARLIPTRELVAPAEWRWIKDNLVILGFLSLFVAGASLDYHFLHSLVDSSPILERLSLWVLGFFGAVSASLIAQWVQIRKGSQEKIEWKDVWHLIELNVAYSAIVEGLLYGQWLNLLPGIAHFSPTWTQMIVDLLGLSLFYSDPAAFFIYASLLDPKKERAALKEIREKLLGFYIAFGWIWAIWLRLALAYPHNPIISFAFIQMGILSWNVAFAYGRYPDSEALIRKVNAIPIIGRGLAMPLRLIQFVYTHPWYRHFLRHSIPTLYIAYGAALLRDLHFSTSFIAAFSVLALISWIMLFQHLIYRRSFRESLSLIISWTRGALAPVRPAILWAGFVAVAPAAGQSFSQMAGAVQTAASHFWSWLAAVLFFAVGMGAAGFSGERAMASGNGWRSEFLSRMADTVDYWTQRKLMVAPEQFHNFFCNLAYQVPKELTDDWLRRRDFLILLGEVFERARNSRITGSPRIYRLPGTALSKQNSGNDYREHILLIDHPTDSLTGPAIIHLVYRKDLPRFKVTLWRLGPDTLTKAALYLLRTGWGKNGHSHADIEPSDQPSTDKRWVDDYEQNPWSTSPLPRVGVTNFRLWMQDIYDHFERLPMYQGPPLLPHPAFNWASRRSPIRKHLLMSL